MDVIHAPPAEPSDEARGEQSDSVDTIPRTGRWTGRYLLALLALVLAFNGVDRLALGLVLQNIKEDFHLQDAQLGILTGTAFSLFYAAVGVPLARWADRGNRVVLISICTALWSAAVALSGFAVTFTQLLVIRACVAVGEAGFYPAALSLITDYFPPAERPRAVALFLQGNTLGIVIGFLAGGWLNEAFGWRKMFVVLAIPGLCLALITWSTLREFRADTAVGPRRERREPPARRAKGSLVERVQLITLPDICIRLWYNHTFRYLLLYTAAGAFASAAVVQWIPVLFVRSYHLSTGEFGTWSAAIFGFSQMIGTYLGGEWASRLAAGRERLQMKVFAVLYCAVGALTALIAMAPNRDFALALLAPWVLVGAVTGGPVMAIIQTVVPARTRATATALLLLCSMLIGSGLGPPTTGALSDLYHSWAGAGSLRYALLTLSPGYALGAWYLWRASRTVTRDLSEAATRAY